MLECKITTAEDLISLRFLLGLEVSELAEMLGHEGNFRVLRLERGEIEINRYHANTMIGVCYLAPHSEYVLSKYKKLNSKKYVAFLKTLTKNKNVPYSRSVRNCCTSPRPTLTIGKGKREVINGRQLPSCDQLQSLCSNCGDIQLPKDSEFRRYLLENKMTFILYNEIYYSAKKWNRLRKPIKPPLKPTPMLKSLPINDHLDLIKFRFLASLSQDQLATRLGVNLALIGNTELENRKLTVNDKFALAAIYYEETKRMPGFDKKFKDLDSQKAFDTWLGYTKKKHMLPKVARPVCASCESEDLELFKRQKSYGYECNECGHKAITRDSYTLKRSYHLLNDERMNILDPKWYLGSE